MSDKSKPVEGETFECESCGMQILITVECQCESGEPFFSCCDKQMSSSNTRSD